MAKQVQMARPASVSGDAEPKRAEFLDPVAMEARLVEARARRADAIARRNSGVPPEVAPAETPAGPRGAVAVPRHHAPAPSHPPALSHVPEPSHAPAPSPAVEPMFAEARSFPRKRRGTVGAPVLLGAIFLAGLIGGGAAVVLAPRDLRQVITGSLTPMASPVVPPQRARPVAVPDVMAEDPPAPLAGSAMSAVKIPGLAGLGRGAVAPAAPPPPATDSARDSWGLFSSGKSPEEIARLRRIAASTVMQHLAENIAAGKPCDSRRFYTADEQARMEAAFAIHGLERLGPVKDSLGETITYGQLHICRAMIQARLQE